jgi:hypothetical protein
MPVRGFTPPPNEWIYRDRSSPTASRTPNPAGAPSPAGLLFSGPRMWTFAMRGVPRPVGVFGTSRSRPDRLVSACTGPERLHRCFAKETPPAEQSHGQCSWQRCIEVQQRDRASPFQQLQLDVGRRHASVASLDSSIWQGAERRDSELLLAGPQPCRSQSHSAARNIPGWPAHPNHTLAITQCDSRGAAVTVPAGAAQARYAPA